MPFYFNSIKVRLEPLGGALSGDLNQNFNSIKVRLERCRGLRTQRPDIRFQFHKGTIRTSAPPRV